MRTIPKTDFFPRRITLEVTNACNLSCTFCPRQFMEYPIGFMKEALFRKLIDEIADADCHTIVPFFRGEPLLHRRCLDLISYAKDKKCVIQLASNASLLTNEVARGLVEMGVDFVSLSFDTIDIKEYASLRMGGDLIKAMNGAKFLFKERDRQSSKMQIQISAVDTGMPDQAKADFTDFWKGRADRIRIYRQHTKDGQFGCLNLKCHPLEIRSICKKPFEEMVVYWDGQVAICNHDWNKSHELGSVKDDSIQLVWNGTGYKKLRENHQKLIFEKDELCYHCDHWRQYCERSEMIGEVK